MAAEATPSPSRGANLQASAERFALQSPSTKASPRMGDRAPWCGASPVATPQRTRRRLNPAGCSPLAIRWDIDSNRASTVDPSGPACGEDPTEADFSAWAALEAAEVATPSPKAERRSIDGALQQATSTPWTTSPPWSWRQASGGDTALLSASWRRAVASELPFTRRLDEASPRFAPRATGSPCWSSRRTPGAAPSRPAAVIGQRQLFREPSAPSSPPREEEATADEVESEDLSCVSSMTPTRRCSSVSPSGSIDCSDRSISCGSRGSCSGSRSCSSHCSPCSLECSPGSCGSDSDGMEHSPSSKGTSSSEDDGGSSLESSTGDRSPSEEQDALQSSRRSVRRRLDVEL
ncbi:unnamed protein product [Polarella glacialis]|uniref:Uncharacterized protein n=1 Tax=Polarella glacialis TaxID=89957 RepID=A0A813GPB0_POLGL|nr:unnamed protein product [Polarella glacialis]